MSSRRTIAALLALALVAAAPAPAAARLRVTSHQVSWPVGRRVRVVQLSDLHVGRATDPKLLLEAVKRTRELRPDLLVMTGDYLNRSLGWVEGLRKLAAELPRPCLATLGNHDHWSGAEGVRQALRRAGVQVLSNQSTVVSGPGWKLTVVGIDDAYTGHQSIRAAFAGLRAPRDTLVLTHYPNAADAIAKLGGRLILTGHTHGGHFAVPIVTVALARATGLRYVSGWYTVGGARLYVNAGIGGGLFRARIGERAQPELAVFELAPEKAQPTARGGKP